jgi:lysophospholipase L1-like esterase
VKEQWRLIFSDERGTPHVFGHRPNVKTTVERGEYRYEFASNGDGLREQRDYDYLERSVVFLGDSIVEGAGVNDDETMDSVFEELTGVVSLNFGLGAANTIQEYHWLVSRYRQSYNTKLIVLVFCLNDFEQNPYLRYFDPEAGTWLLWRDLTESAKSDQTTSSAQPAEFRHRVRSLLRSSYALYSLWGLLRHAVEGDVDFYRAGVVTATERAMTESHLLRIRDFAASIDAQMVVLLFPQESPLDRDYAPGQRMQDVIIEQLDTHEIPYIDLFELQRDAVRAQPEIDWFYDDTHPYVSGHRLIGEHLAVELPKVFPEVFTQDGLEAAERD